MSVYEEYYHTGCGVKAIKCHGEWVVSIAPPLNECSTCFQYVCKEHGSSDGTRYGLHCHQDCYVVEPLNSE